MRPKMAIFKEEKWLCRVPKFFRQVQLIEKLRKKCHVGDQPFYVGGDATKNHDFQTGKQRLQGTIFLFPMGAMRLKMTVSKQGNSVCRVPMALRHEF